MSDYLKNISLGEQEAKKSNRFLGVMEKWSEKSAPGYAIKTVGCLIRDLFQAVLSLFTGATLYSVLVVAAMLIFAALGFSGFEESILGRLILRAAFSVCCLIVCWSVFQKKGKRAAVEVLSDMHGEIFSLHSPLRSVMMASEAVSILLTIACFCLTVLKLAKGESLSYFGTAAMYLAGCCACIGTAAFSHGFTSYVTQLRICPVCRRCNTLLSYSFEEKAATVSYETDAKAEKNNAKQKKNSRKKRLNNSEPIYCWSKTDFSTRDSSVINRYRTVCRECSYVSERAQQNKWMLRGENHD